MSSVGATVFVCTSCRRITAEGEGTANGIGLEKPGLALLADLTRRLEERGIAEVMVEGVDCLAVCKRPCTIAVTDSNKWTYVIGDLSEVAHVDEVIDAAVAFARTDNGIVPWKERPQTFRKGVIARIPPVGFKAPVPETA